MVMKPRALMSETELVNESARVSALVLDLLRTEMGADVSAPDASFVLWVTLGRFAGRAVTRTIGAEQAWAEFTQPEVKAVFCLGFKDERRRHS